MTDEIKQEEPKQETAKKPTAIELIERARQEKEGLAKENERLEKNIKELRELENERLLAGTVGGRVEMQPLTDHDKWVADAKRRYKGTGLDPT